MHDHEQRVLQGVSEPTTGAQTAAVHLCHLPQHLSHHSQHTTLNEIYWSVYHHEAIYDIGVADQQHQCQLCCHRAMQG